MVELNLKGKYSLKRAKEYTKNDISIILSISYSNGYTIIRGYGKN